MVSVITDLTLLSIPLGNANEQLFSGGKGKDCQEDGLSLEPSMSENSECAETSKSIEDDDNSTTNRSDKDSDVLSSNLETKRMMKIAQREQNQLRGIRVVTLSFLLLSTITVCTFVYWFTKQFDQRDFELKYEAYAESIQNDVVWEVKYNLALMKQLGSTITSEILASDQVAPNITLPNFEVTGGFADGMGGIMMVSFAPLVEASKRSTWEAYATEHHSWLEHSARLEATHIGHQRPLAGTHQDHETDLIDVAITPAKATPIDDDEEEKEQDVVEEIPKRIWRWNGTEKVPLEEPTSPTLLAPLWQSSPAERSTINADLLSDSRISDLYESMVATNYETTLMSSWIQIDALFDWMIAPGEKDRKKEPHAFLLEPIFADFTPMMDTRDSEASSSLPPFAVPAPIGFVLGLTSYRHLFEGILPEHATGSSASPDSVGEIYCVLTGSSACKTDSITYLIKGSEAIFVGYHDLHEGLDEYEATVRVELYDDTITDDVCVHDLHIYPTPAFRESHNKNKAWLYTSIIALAFGVTSFCFLVYERVVTKREKTKNAALKVVASLFPSGVQDKVLKGAQEGVHGMPEKGSVIASFFPATTVMFADISGFTAWSSTREPEQVFRLLETVYGAMDEIAVRRGVFKVETVGDCYVAVCGLPEPRDDHAVAMTRFARDCQLRMASLSEQLEVALGPDTADLSFRIGMHSGPVTGGVLRGQNARFQLFGDTMNQASRMESTGIKNRIQLSTTTAQILISSGKGKWIEKRPEKVDVKGIGLQETYFFKKEFGKFSSPSVTPRSNVDLDKSTRSSNLQAPAILEPLGAPRISSKTRRLITWNTEVLCRRIKSIIQHRETGDTELSQTVVHQLQKYVEQIASMYRDNPFHNYEHASHVTLSMEKMLSRVQGVDAIGREPSINRYTNDITNDSLAQFAVVYSALIHDVDHTGVSNNQLVKEKDHIAITYGGKSPAENHSISCAWKTLMQPQYKDLVKCLCPKISELKRLKKLVMNTVLATDIFDDDLKESRNLRWNQVFGRSNKQLITALDDSNDKRPEDINTLRVMIVLDHLIQASDVAHTMQHWHVYIKWNERLFHEMNEAYKNGRLGTNPAKFWYHGELRFFDHYVIPLAKKLRECGVFGVSCDEFLNYAETNRKEWETKGMSITKEYSRRYQNEEPEARQRQ